MVNAHIEESLAKLRKYMLFVTFATVDFSHRRSLSISQSDEDLESNIGMLVKHFHASFKWYFVYKYYIFMVAYCMDNYGRAVKLTLSRVISILTTEQPLIQLHVNIHNVT